MTGADGKGAVVKLNNNLSHTNCESVRTGGLRVNNRIYSRSAETSIQLITEYF